MFMKCYHLRTVVFVFVIVLGVTGVVDKAIATTGYWDLFAVDLNPNGLYWDQVSGGTGLVNVLNDPLVSPDPGATNPGSPVFDNASALGGVAYGYGGFDWGTGTLESTAVLNNSIQLLNQANYYLSVVLDTRTGPQTDNLYPSWGTFSNIVVTPQFAAGPGGAIAPQWVFSPFDPDAGTVLVANAPAGGDIVSLAVNDVGALEAANQLRGIWGVGANLPVGGGETGYTVTFDTALSTWDSYNQAGPQVPPPAPQCGPHPTNTLPLCSQVPGKEYSNDLDKNAAGVADPLQNIAFDCTGNCKDTFDYSGSGVNDGEVDAIANARDALFWDVAADKVPMLLSFAPAAANKPGDIYYQMAQADVNGTWATAQQICSQSPPDDVDGLEVWGPCGEPQADDADRFSLVGDPGGTAVFKYSLVTHTSISWITTAALQAAIGTQENIDLDALMCWDLEDDEYEFNPVLGDSIIFSIKETISAGGVFDGGEVWHWSAAGCVFLIHGGEVWNTLHTVGADFGVGTEEVNALEAVPEPGTMALLALGGIGMLLRRRRK